MKKDYIHKFENAERRFLGEPIELREEGSRTITGYAAVFNKDSEDMGGWVERIAPGAFDDVLSDPAMVLFNHDPNLVLARNGVNATLSVDEVGLKYSYEAPNTTLGNDVLELVRTKTIDKSSFAFTVKEQVRSAPENKGDKAIRTITKVARLYDVSPVTYPAYPDTTVGQRCFDMDKREEELRDVAIKTIELELDLFKLKNN